MMNTKQREEFNVLADAMIKFLNDNGHPHMSIIIDTSRAEVVEGICAYVTQEHIKDQEIDYEHNTKD